MIQKLKAHFKEHKQLYIGIGIGVGVTTLAGITMFIMKDSRTKVLRAADSPVMESTGSFNSATSIFGSASNKIVTTIHKGFTGNPGYITRSLETGKIFATQAAAAEYFDISKSILSSHLNGSFPDAQGLHFERIGILA